MVTCETAHHTLQVSNGTKSEHLPTVLDWGNVEASQAQLLGMAPEPCRFLVVKKLGPKVVDVIRTNSDTFECIKQNAIAAGYQLLKLL